MISYHVLSQPPRAKYITAQNAHGAKVLWIRAVQCSGHEPVWLDRTEMCCQCQRHARIPETSCENVNYHINISTC